VNPIDSASTWQVPPTQKGAEIMGRKFVECHEKSHPGAPECSAIFAADSDKELLEIAVRHGINVHGHANTEAYREQVRKEFKQGTPPK
jgi:hypothetical protein